MNQLTLKIARFIAITVVCFFAANSAMAESCNPSSVKTGGCNSYTKKGEATCNKHYIDNSSIRIRDQVNCY